MPRPESKIIQLTIDGREVRAPEGEMLVEAARLGDIEIPYFCFERKLGKPVGACRMCLVEIEGIPKLQTSCSTPVKDGMVVHTQTQRVRGAQNAIVEFLLVNHPLDCPVCDKGGECPLQDITFGWGAGRSRFIEPKRHFVKPLALSPLVAIDRERCILCYRCVRFSQEIAEDYQLIFAERGAHTFVATHDGHPYVAPFSGNIIELCPVGALTSQPYRFRARPWDIEGGAGVCTLCPAQCNVSFTVRDEKVMRVLAREHPEVDDGWLCDKGRFAYQAMHVDERITAPMVREGGELREASWEEALDRAAGLAGHRGRVGALVGGGASNEEGFLLARLMREGLASVDIDSRVGDAVAPVLARAAAAPALQATVPDLEFAHTVLVVGCDPQEDAPILDLRIRKGVRRHGTKLAVATARPSALDPNAAVTVRLAPGGEAAFLAGLAEELRGDGGGELAQLLRDGGKDVVIVWGERLGAAALPHLLSVADLLGLGAREGAGLLEIPGSANGRGLREAGVLADSGPGYSALAAELEGRSSSQMAAATAEGELTAFYLFETDPVRDLPDRSRWERALADASLVVAHASVLTEGIREHADVVFPAESYAEKEGTVVHPDGRVQRLRIAVAHPDEVRAGWSVIAELARRLGHDLGVSTSPEAFAQLVQAVPFYAGLTLEGLAGRGARWPARAEASAFPAPGAPAPAPGRAAVPPPGPVAGPTTEDPRGATAPAPPSPSAPPSGSGTLRLGVHRPLWASPNVEISPALKYAIARQHAELSPADAQRLGLTAGETVEVASNGTAVKATVAVHSGIPAGTVFLADGLAEDSANVFTGFEVEVRKP
ncbi:MAG TPA: NADH-quinone oxidoreductase subunit NuoG [Solirubrobacteraceae bacterium]|jgi:NADH-quinone oxidoreductase subunit G|nr:NADH-quinone oxidoreductase subunit NuoG [Solirubrobacteraceae bacterium]